jgi:hypothetical protein
LSIVLLFFLSLKTCASFIVTNPLYYDLRYLKREPWATPYISYAPHKEVKTIETKEWKQEGGGGQVAFSVSLGLGRASRGGLRQVMPVNVTSPCCGECSCREMYEYNA